MKLADLNEQIDSLRDNMGFIQDNINDCQSSIVDLEEFKVFILTIMTYFDRQASFCG